MENKINQRILALDILRGITIAGMILVNNPGSWSYVYAPLGHAKWNGLTPTDLVFPFFMFIMGISMFISLSKYRFELSMPAVKKIVKRTILLYLVGLGIAWFSLTCRIFNGLGGENLPFVERLGRAMWNFDEIRILGVIPRLAVCYGVVSLIVISIKHQYILPLIVFILISYFALLMVGNGFEYNQTNILSIVDYKILGEQHMYNDNGIDPEGVLSTIPAIAHVLLGFFIGKMIMNTRDIHQKMERLFIVGGLLTFFGFLLSYGCPINKKTWSPTFVVTTIGLASTLLALLIWTIDIKGYKKWCRFFEVFGINPLFMYVLGAFLSIILGNIMIEQISGSIQTSTYTSLKSWIYSDVLQPIFNDYPGSLIYALLFVGFNWIFGYYLYKKRIYIKL
ncbi:MAG: acyltransferase family protein [Paludibacteraceae bacterium]